MKLSNDLLISIIFVAGGISTFSQGSDNINENHKTAREIFAELIEINTTVNRGSSKAAEAMAVRLISAGFGQGDIIMAGPQPEHLNLVVRYRGKASFALYYLSDILTLLRH